MIEGGDGGSADPVESDRRTLRTRQLRPRRCRPATRGHPRSLPITLRHKIFFVAVAVIGALAWTVVAFFRNEPVNAVWIVVAAGCTYIIGFRFYARLIEMKVVRPRDDHATPAEILDDGTDYVPTDRRVVFGHHFAAIAGAGPLVGPVLATQMGYLPSSIWIVVGAVLAGCVQDYLVLWISVRRRGRSWVRWFATNSAPPPEWPPSLESRSLSPL